jgi:hypothetical protein
MKMKYLNYLNTLMALVMVCLQAAPALSMAVENGAVDYRHIGSNLLPIDVASSIATLILVTVSVYLYRRKKISNKPV